MYKLTLLEAAEHGIVAAKIKPRGSMPAQPKVLVVEDDFLLLEMYAITLSGQGYDVSRASDGHQGLDLIKTEKPDLVLLDLNMPSISGFQVLADLQEEGNTVPVIVISNTDEQQAIQKCKELGAKEYVVKAHTNLDQIKDIVSKYVTA